MLADIAQAIPKHLDEHVHFVHRPFDVEDDDVSVAFAKSFTGRGGSMIYCTNEDDIRSGLYGFMGDKHSDALVCFNDNLARYITNIGFQLMERSDESLRCETGITLCSKLIAWNGSIVIEDSAANRQSLMRVFPHTLIVLGFTSQVVESLQSGVGEDSAGRTAEQLLVLTPGMRPFNSHGYRLHLLLVEDQ
ncbi:MAG: LUD domain-containing protein [Bacteroidales bacterium]|nr:LUD domain-containing protein [Bacteroidales bacterium]